MSSKCYVIFSLSQSTSITACKQMRQKATNVSPFMGERNYILQFAFGTHIYHKLLQYDPWTIILRQSGQVSGPYCENRKKQIDIF